MADSASVLRDDMADATAPGRVLLVDDNPANLKALEALLADPRIELVAAGSGQEALKHLLEGDVAAILMDVQMPEMDGFQTTRLIRARARSAHVPIIFITAVFLDEASMKKAYSLGALDYMTKPFDPDVLRAKVQALVENYRASDLIARQAAALAEREREAARARAAEAAAQRVQDQFLATLSHELRAPLNAILGWTALLEGEPGLSPRLSRAVATIARNARTQSRLVDELVDLSHLAADKLVLHERALDVDTVVQAALSSTAAEALARKVRVELDVAPVGYRTTGDPIRLEQALVGLLSNAIKFSEPGQQVLVELHRRGDRFEIRVKDAGIGIAPDQLPRIFDPFYQVDGTRTRAFSGMGIGLTLARRLVELHGGSIEAYSAGRGTGATFVLGLPVRVADASATASVLPPLPRVPVTPLPRATTAPLRGRRVLIVDDEEDTRELLALVLGDAGADTITAAGAAEALPAFRAGRFDVVISDVGMPDEDGLTLMRKLRAHEAARGDGDAVLAVALSGYAGGDETLAAGFQVHLTKPAEPAQLIALLTRLLANPGP